MTGCFCYLVNHTQPYLTDFERSLILLRKNYLARFGGPVIAFHEAGLTEEVRRNLVERTQVPIQFVQLEFAIPSHIDKFKLYGARLGYMHMCRFFADTIFHHPALATYDYYCRLDTDSFIHSPARADIFKDAAKAKSLYGFIADHLHDQPEFYSGLWDTARAFVNARPEYQYQKRVDQIPEGRVYYTNFELCYLPWFRSDPWSDYFKAIDTTGGIYYTRWGDHTIRYLGVNLLMPPERVMRVTSLPYTHQIVTCP